MAELADAAASEAAGRSGDEGFYSLRPHLHEPNAYARAIRSPLCTFCDLDSLRGSSVLYLENDLCVFANSEDLDGDLLRGSGVIVPKEHRPTVFELTPPEIGATFDLLRRARVLLDERYRPDGFNIGWNCYAAAGQAAAHAHLHVLLRFADEPRAGQGIRWPLRQPDNVRPDPAAPGSGSRDFLAPS